MAAERRDHERGEDAGHHRQQHAAPPSGPQRGPEHDDREHRAQRELQPDRLMHQRQHRDDDAVGHTPRHRGRPRARRRQRHGEHRQRGRAEQIRPRRVRRERNPEWQQRNQHGDHQPALGTSPTKQHHAHHQHKAGKVHRRRQPAQTERGGKVVSGHQADQFACETAPDEAERVVHGVVRHPVHVERNNVDRETQHGCRPDRNRYRDADVAQRARALTRFGAQVHHRRGPNRSLSRTDSGQPMRSGPVRVSMPRCSRCRCRRRRWSGTDFR